MRKVKLKKFLTSPIKDLFSLDSVSSLTDIGSEVFELSETLQKQDVQDIHPLLEKSASLLDILVTPEAELVSSCLPFFKVATALTKYLKDKKEPQTAVECMLLTCVKAYSVSLVNFLDKYTREESISTQILKNSKKLEKSIELEIDAELEIDKRDASRTLRRFPTSELADILRKTTVELLENKGLRLEDAVTLVERAIWNSHRYITEIWASMPNQVKEFTAESLSDWNKELDKYDVLDEYLTSVAAEVKKPIFNEKNPSISLEDIYIPLEIQKQTVEEDTFNIHTRIRKMLSKRDNSRKTIYVQGGPGRGKTGFCKMFFAEALKKLHPSFTPVFIELSRVREIRSSFNKTLEDCLSARFFTSNSDWLDSSHNTRFLILMDGLDELVLKDRNLAEDFLKQALLFQKYNDHQILITSRKWVIGEFNSVKDDDFYHIEIQSMNTELQQKWLSKWSRVIGDSQFILKFNQFIEPFSRDIQELLEEPLLLYLIAKLYKDNLLDEHLLGIQNIDEDGDTVIKAKIYKETITWVLSQQAKTTSLNRIRNLKPKQLRQLLREAAICTFQSDGNNESLVNLKRRFRKKTNPINKLIQSAGEIETADNGSSQDKSRALNNLLISFYINSNDETNLGTFEFSHRSFWEFLFAERLVNDFNTWINAESDHNEKGQNKRFSDRAEEIVDLLGCGKLTSEIVNYIKGLISDLDTPDFINIFQGLYEFYGLWSSGTYIDYCQKEEYCRKKALQLTSFGKSVRLRHVDLYTGLNIIILLAEFNRHLKEVAKESFGQLVFHPCKSSVSSEIEDPEKFARIIGYSYCSSFSVAGDDIESSFSRLASPFLSHVDLNASFLFNCNLSGFDLRQSNLSNADLTGTDLRDTKLIGANLQRANLHNANVSQANLDDTKLDNAVLENANFSRASLRESTLIDTDLRFANFSNANLFKADLSDKFAAEEDNRTNFEIEFDNDDTSNSVGDSDDSSDKSLRNDYFQGSIFKNANLNGANLSYRRLSGADFSGADFSNAILDEIEPNDANFDGANLSHHSLDDLNFSGSNLNNADLTGSSMVAVDLSGVSLCGAILMGTNLSSGFLEGSNFEGANLTGANLRNAHLVGANLNNADLTGADLTEADLNYIRYNSATKWKHAKGLKNARNLPADWTC